MVNGPVTIPSWVIVLSGYSSVISSIIIFSSILLHLLNYRKPLQQRLMIRIHLIVPLFAVTCYSMLVDQGSSFNKFFLEPLREVYEAFVIYTFFSLLTDMLGGEKNVIVLTSGRQPVSHPGFLGLFLAKLDISDPHTFLAIKRGILQYVWLKPFICFGIIFSEILGLYDVNDMGIGSIYLWFTILYNMSVSLSLYCLAIFWKILWNDLKPFKPVGKFLCVKLIIFASYWQGILIAILNFAGVLGPNEEMGADTNIGVSIQNALLCIELIAFAIGHWTSFSYKVFTISKLPYGRLEFYYAFKDMIGIRDLIYDFKLTFYGDYYKDYKQFDSVEALIAHPESRGTMSRINKGMRYHSDGKQKHWLPVQAVYNSSNMQSQSEVSTLFNSLDANSLSENHAPSFISTNTSTKGLYSPKSLNSALDSPLFPSFDINDAGSSITEMLNSSEYNYDQEFLDEDEIIYQETRSVVNKYRLDQVDVKKIINYPIVDELVDSHLYGYHVKKLRANRSKQLQRNSDERESHKGSSNNYGSIV